NLEHDRIGFGSDRLLARERNAALEDDVILFRDRRLPAGFDHQGLMRLDQDGGVGHAMAGTEPLAEENLFFMPGSAGIEPSVARGFRRRGFDRQSRFWEFARSTDRFDRHRLYDDGLGRVDEAEARAMRRLE